MEKSYYLSDLTLTARADQSMKILIPLMRALVAEHNLSLASGIDMSPAIARALWLMGHGVSYALVIAHWEFALALAEEM